MKVALVIHAIRKNTGGQGRVNYELAKYLAKKGHNVHLFANGVDEDLKRTNNITFHFVPVVHFTYLLKGIVFLIFTLGKINKDNYDIIHLNGAVKLGWYNVNTCHFVHSAWVEVSRRFRNKRNLKWIYYSIYTFFNAWLERLVYTREKGVIVAVSNKIKDELTFNIGVKLNRIRVIHNGVDTKEFNSRDRPLWREKLIREFQFNSDDFVVLSIGSSTGRKGLISVIKALKSLENDKIKLLVVGNIKVNLRREIRKYRVETRVKFAGFRYDMERIYKGADLFVFPTRYDPCPLIVLEAMASSLPVIVSESSICGASELIANMVNGVLLGNVTDADEIASKIELLSKNEDLRQRLSEEARKTAEKHSWHKMAEQYESLYYHLVSKKDGIVRGNS